MGRTSPTHFFWEYSPGLWLLAVSPSGLSTLLLSTKLSTKWLNLRIVLPYFFPEDCSYEGAADVVNQQNESKVSVGEL